MLTGKLINRYYLKYALFFLIGIVSLVAVDVVQLYIPEYMGQIVDMFADVELQAIDMDAFLKIIKGVLYCAVVMFIGRIVWRLSIFYASTRIEADLRHRMFLKSERLSLRYYHENKVGTIMAWFTTDLETIEEFLGWGTIMLVDAVFLSVLVLVKMFMLDWVLTLLSLVPILLIVVWGALVEKFMSERWLERQKQFDSLYDFSQEAFTGIRVIKAFVKETQQLHAFSKIARKNKDTNIGFVKVAIIFDVIIEIIITVIMALLMGAGGYFVYHCVTGTPIVLFNHEVLLTAGTLVIFIGYFDNLIWPMIALGQVVSMRSRAKASLQRITEYMNQEEEVKSPENAVKLEKVEGRITFNHFSFHYPDTSVHSIKDITLEIRPGETVGIVGKIGSGKTTLVNSLLRMYNIEKNSILIDGTDLMDLDITSLRDAISYVPQDNFLFSDKVSNNIAFSNREIERDKIYEAANFADVHANIVDFKEGYDTISGERGVTLSGGQKQRISIARAYLKNSPIMILDDAVSAVDVRTEQTILKNIEEKRKGRTTLIIASRVSTVSRCDRIIVMKDGEVEAFDTPEKLSEISETYQKMVLLQALEKEVEGGAH
ncbi:MAG: ABC transporter ATP-binding protein [Erysipelotrichaceae bacterium]|nr:ABC transporter ATP-binding protein [Erysipelotrichaceae bacterium]